MMETNMRKTELRSPAGVEGGAPPSGPSAAAAGTAAAAAAGASGDSYAPPPEPALPPTDVTLKLQSAALVVIDPQVDFLSPDGVAWGVVGESVRELGAVANIGRLFRAAQARGLAVAVSPHYYYPTDHGWRIEGPLETLMHRIGMFYRKGALTLDGFRGSGADFLEEYKTFIEDGETIVTSPHKVYGPPYQPL
jgi:hypothetical protein